ncbi:MAG: FtsQ-type POTRA domain-containing protein [Desulfobacterales bacterium]
MKPFKAKNRKNRYRRRPIQQRIDLKRRLSAGLKIICGVFCIVFLSTVYMLVYGVFTQCDYFKAKHIEITGTDLLEEDDILTQASLYSGINILSVNLFTARKRLLGHPDIEDADIVRTYPDGLRIRIKEHRPMAVVDLGRRFLMNDSGKIYREWRDADDMALPVVEGLRFSDFTGGGTPEKMAYSAVLKVLQAGSSPDSILPNAAIRRISVDREMGVTLFTEHATRVIKLGFGDFTDKYNRLKRVTQYLKDSCRIDFESIDLMNADRIVVSPMVIEPDDKRKKEV